MNFLIFPIQIFKNYLLKYYYYYINIYIYNYFNGINILKKIIIVYKNYFIK